MMKGLLAVMSVGVLLMVGYGTGNTNQDDCASGEDCSHTCVQQCTVDMLQGASADVIEECVDLCTGIRSCLGATSATIGAPFDLATPSTVSYYGGTYLVGKNNNTYCMRYSNTHDDKEVTMGCDYIGSSVPSSGSSFAEKDFCCGVKLNTDVPFVGRCINQIDGLDGNTQAGTATAFPRLMRALANIVMTLILVGSMIMLVVSGVMWSSGNADQGKKMMRRVILSLVLLGASGIILRLINPIFFG